jgi:hypothetical protein
MIILRQSKIIESHWQFDTNTLYHGSPNKFSKVKFGNKYSSVAGNAPMPDAFFLTRDAWFALIFAGYSRAGRFNRNGFIYEFTMKPRLNIFNGKNKNDVGFLIKSLKQLGKDNPDVLRRIGLLSGSGCKWDDVEKPDVMWGIKDAGFDGVAIIESGYLPNGTTEYSQNVGIFNPADVSFKGIISVSDFLDKYPLLISRNDSLNKPTVNNININPQGQVDGKLLVNVRKGAKFPYPSLLRDKGVLYYSQLLKQSNTLQKISQRELLSIILSVKSAKTVNEYLNNIYNFMISKGIDNEFARKFSVGWLDYLGLLV